MSTKSIIIIIINYHVEIGNSKVRGAVRTALEKDEHR